MTAHSHLAIQALALHLLLERAQRLIDVVVANLNFHRFTSHVAHTPKAAAPDGPDHLSI
jgi:hypothetical protein